MSKKEENENKEEVNKETKTQEEKVEVEEKEKFKNNFFKKFWYSIVNIERYPEMAAEGLGKAIIYIAKVVAILAIVLSLGIVYETYNLMQDGINYLQNEFPEFSYKEEKLNVNSEDIIVISQEDSVLGKIIIDTKTNEEQTVNKYINEVSRRTRKRNYCFKR